MTRSLLFISFFSYPLYITLIFGVVAAIAIFISIKFYNRISTKTDHHKTSGIRMAKVVVIFETGATREGLSSSSYSKSRNFGLLLEYINAFGKNRRIKTKPIYTLDQAQIIEKSRVVEIEIIGDHAVIRNFSNLNINNNTSPYKTCSYCKSKSEKRETQCPNCGASDFEE